jgi:hypothetical protein
LNISVQPEPFDELRVNGVEALDAACHELVEGLGMNGIALQTCNELDEVKRALLFVWVDGADEVIADALRPLPSEASLEVGRDGPALPH